MTEANDPFGLRGRICVVTGGGSGIGQGVAVALAGEGAKVAVLDVNEAGNAETLGLITGAGGEGLALRCDVARRADIEAARDAVRARWGDAQVLVNVAGIIRHGPIENLALEDWNQVLGVNLTGYFLCSQIFGRAMLERRQGALVHVSSVMADFPCPYGGAYSATKAAIRMLSRQFATEWGGRGVRSNCVAPSLVITPMSKTTYDNPDFLARRNATVPTGRIGLPADIAQAVLFLAGARADYVNGTDLLVDGGFMSNLMALVPRPSVPGTN